MSKEIKIAGSISFGGKRLNVYGDLDTPLFKACLLYTSPSPRDA